MHLEDLRSEAKRAWDSRDFKDVVRAFEELRNARTAADDAKLRDAVGRLTIE
jgi:hypothetical protein